MYAATAKPIQLLRFLGLSVRSCRRVSSKPGSSRIWICRRERSRRICVLSLSLLRAWGDAALRHMGCLGKKP